MSIKRKVLRNALKRFSKSKTTRTITYKAAKRMSSAQKRALAKAVKASAIKRSSSKLVKLKGVKLLSSKKNVKAISRKAVNIANKKALRANNRKAINTLAKAYSSKSQQKAVRKSANALLKTVDSKSVNTQQLQEYYKRLAKVSNTAIKLKKAKVQ